MPLPEATHGLCHTGGVERLAASDAGHGLESLAPIVTGSPPRAFEELKMATWAEFAEAAPDLAAEGARLLHRGDIEEGLLATVRGDDLPRIHPIWIRVVDGVFYAFILKSAKRTDLERDGRYALHSHQDPAKPSEFSVRGRAGLVAAGPVYDRVASEWYFEVDDSYRLFEFDIEAAILGVRGDPDEWPPRYTSWKAGQTERSENRSER